MLPLAVDIMGGDNAPRAIVRGVGEALDQLPGIGDLILVGDEATVRAELALIGKENHPRIAIVHAPEAVTMVESPTVAVRGKKLSSISVAVDLVKHGRAGGVVSAGNTGATLMAATIKLRNLPGIERAAIATLLPHRRGHFVMLDSGANVDAKPLHLVHFAIMGDLYARQILGVTRPRIGLLSNGTEDEKGNELTKAAFDLLKQVPSLNFIGNVEGTCLFEGKVDVVVCDGFNGNIVLKTAEGLAHFFSSMLKEKLKKSPLRLMGGVLAYGALKELKRAGDSSEYGGAPFVGVNGVVIKCHGASNAKAVRNALRVAREFMERDVNRQIIQRIQELHLEPAAPVAVP